MSADRWDTCPRCFAGALKKWAEAVRVHRDRYGTIPGDEWLAERAALPAMPNEEDREFQTFREDFEWWTTDGELHGSFSGHCSQCRLSVEHTVTPITFYTPEPAREGVTGNG